MMLKLQATVITETTKSTHTLKSCSVYEPKPGNALNCNESYDY